MIVFMVSFGSSAEQFQIAACTMGGRKTRQHHLVFNTRTTMVVSGTSLHRDQKNETLRETWVANR
jgi:hypothetical protein